MSHLHCAGQWDAPDTFLVAKAKHLRRSDLRRRHGVPVNHSGGGCGVGGESGASESAVRKQSKRDAGVSSLSPFS